MLVNSYEDVVRGCRAERDVLPDIPAFGTPEYELDRSVDRLICITTIIRNLSFYESNHPLLADELVIKFLCVVVRYLGTRNMLLRTHTNTLDFMKDVIIFLSNLAQTIELPGREQALCLLHFLLAFAPCPQPNMTASGRIIFSHYDPAVHRYLPPAVDSLAKLLARDEPNRTFYKTIFTADANSSPPFDLLTRTFALAISPIPDYKQDNKQRTMIPIIEVRKPYLMQGMLAADILANLAPGYETNLARSWLTSEDGFAETLVKLIMVLCSDHPPPPPHQRAPTNVRVAEEEASQHITLSGISVLRRLAEKARNPDDPQSDVPANALLPKEIFLGALLMKQQRPDTNREVIKNLCAYVALDN